MSVWAVVLAAGSGQRMRLAQNKVLASLGGRTVLQRTVEAFDGLVDGVIVVASARDFGKVQALPMNVRIVAGGETRQQSVLCGLAALHQPNDIVLVHDAARPFVTPDVISRCIESARTRGSGVACVPVKDTVKRVGLTNVVMDTLPRDTLRAAQTPQAFRVGALRHAIEALEAEGLTATDDASAMEAAGETVHLVEGDYRNIKLTTPEDMQMAEFLLGQGSGALRVRTGYGCDAHRLVEGRDLILCGVTVPYEKGLLGHSDADVATHALMDALLGAAALGDIGSHFPDSDAQYRGISSLALLEKVAALLSERGYQVRNVDVTIVAERPKLKPFIPEMVDCLSQTLSISPDLVSVKATTTEGMGFEGEGLGMSAHAVATILEVG